jgi:hypothetical protein
MRFAICNKTPSRELNLSNILSRKNPAQGNKRPDDELKRI